MATKSELQNEALKWQRRIAMVSQSGQNAMPVVELARTDLTRIVQGGAALPEDQIVSMIGAAYTGNVMTPTPQATPTTQGTDWNPLHIIGGFGKDLQTDVRSFIPGLLHQAGEATQASKWGELGTDVTQLKPGSLSYMAKEVRALPIIGPLVPGTFALSAGTSGMTNHPLNFLLDVFAIASEGTKLASVGSDAAEAGTTMAALQEGHPLQAIAKSTGLEDRMQQFMQTHNIPQRSQLMNMPVWRAFNGLSRIMTRQLRDEALNELDQILPRGMSQEERATIVKLAQTYNERDLKPAVPAPIDDITAAGSNLQQAFVKVPYGRDITAFTIGPDGPLATAALYFNRQMARDQLGEIADHPEMFNEVRVDPRTITFDETTGSYTGRDVRPNTYYEPEMAKILKDVREYSQKWNTRNKPGKESMQVPISINGKTELYHVKTLPAKAQATYNIVASQFANLAKKAEHLSNEVRRWEEASSGVTEQYRRFGESAEETAQRTKTIPSITSIYQVAQDFIIQGMYGDQRTLYEALDKAFQAQSETGIRSSLNNIVKATTEDPKINEYARYLRDSTSGIKGREANALKAMAKKEAAGGRLQEARSRLASLNTKMEAAKNDLYDTIAKVPSERFQPILEQHVRGAMKQAAWRATVESGKVRAAVQGSGLSAGIQQALDEYTKLASKIDDAHTPEEMAMAIDPKTFKRVMADSFHDWTDMMKAGFDPIWVHQISSDWYYRKTFANVKPLTRNYTPADDTPRIFDFSPHVLDIHAQLTHQAIDYLQEEGTKQFTEFLVKNSGVIETRDNLVTEVRDRYPGFQQAEAKVNELYTPWKPYGAGKDDPEYMMPKVVKKGLDKMLQGRERIIVRGVVDPIHRTFRVAVLTGVRHMVHVGLGGLVQTALRANPSVIEELAHPVAIMDMIKTGKVPSEFHDLEGALNEALQSGALTKGMYEQHVDQLIAYRGGSKAGEWWRNSQIGRGIHQGEVRLNNLENMVTDMYRTATFINELRHNGANQEAALAAVNKTLVDVDNLTPFEKSTLTQFFPFWSFTRHTLQYVLTYPADHPLRASILAHVAQMTEETNQSGHPNRLSKLFYLGEPDALGNVTTVDFSNLNPFRSMAGAFSMAGFLSGLAPEFQIALKQFGINTLTGTPSLHTNFSYDAYTGTNQATRPKVDPLSWAEAFIPQVSLLDHYLLFTDTMRQLKASNPEAYKRSVFQELNLPFAIAPINIYDVRAKSAAAQYRDAQQVVADAMRTGNTSNLRQYVAVPFEGRLYDGQQVANYIDHYDQLFPGISPHAVIVPPKRKRKKTPL